MSKEAKKELVYLPEKHEYWLDDVKLISVTQLMQAVGLAQDYSTVDPEVLKKKAEYGKLVHADIDDFVKMGALGFTKELYLFKDYIEKNDLKVACNEQKVHNDKVAGTLDILFADGTIADFKNTYALHQEQLSWQLSLYKRLYDADTEISQKVKITKGKVFWFHKDGDDIVLEVKDIPLKSDEEVDKAIQCYLSGTQYTQKLVGLEHNELEKICELMEVIAEKEAELKTLAIQKEQLHEAIKGAMEKNNVVTFSNDLLKITYTAPTQRKIIDSARLKKEHPDIAEEYQKVTDVKSSVRITLK